MARPRVLRDGTLIWPHRGKPPAPAEGYEIGSDPFVHLVKIQPCFHRHERRQTSSCCDYVGVYCAAKDKTVNRADCSNCSRLPTLKAQVETFVWAIKNLVESDKKLSDKDEIEYRKAVCAECPYRDGKRCTACGCLLAAKQALASETCPAEAW
jgi:hypothetical protein